MQTYNASCIATTSTVPDFVDITSDIEAAVSAGPVAEGRVTVFAPDRNSSLIVNERESGLLEDLKGAMGRLPKREGVAPPLGSASVVLPIADGKLRLGTWQRVLLVELGEPGTRSVTLQIIGEAA